MCAVRKRSRIIDEVIELVSSRQPHTRARARTHTHTQEPRSRSRIWECVGRVRRGGYCVVAWCAPFVCQCAYHGPPARAARHTCTRKILPHTPHTNAP